MIIILILLLFLFGGALPRWDYSASWGYGPSGFLALLFVVLLVFLLFGRR